MDHRPPDYRTLDYRLTDYRGADPQVEGGFEGIDWAAALWRYRYAVLVPVLVGIVLSVVVFSTQASIYRSTATLVVESDRPTTFDSASGELISAVPPAELLMMQLRSEHVLNYAADHPLLADTAERLPRHELLHVLSEGIVFQDALKGAGRNDRATAFLLHFDDPDPQFAVNAVATLSAGLQEYFNEKSESSATELRRLITTAKDKLLPELNNLEEQYRGFRQSTALNFDSAGNMINPFREKQIALQSRRLQLEDELRELGTKMSGLRATVQSSENPMVVVEVAKRLMGDDIDSVRKLFDDSGLRLTDRRLLDSDYSLAAIELERELTPLVLEREEFAAKFGPGHPSVRQLDQRIEGMRERLNDVISRETSRKAELRRQAESPSGDELQLRLVQAERAVNSYISSLETNQAVVQAQLNLIDDQIEQLSSEASKLAEAESDNAMYLRKIERAQKLFDQFEEQMTRINLSSSQDANLSVRQLRSPSRPQQVAPVLWKFLAAGLLLGGLTGLTLVYLLESNSRTFRSADEIAEALGMRILAHVPTDAHTLPSVSAGQRYRFQGIDPGLSSLHRPYSATSEAIRRLRTSVLFEAATIQAKVIQVSSPVPEDGKSTLSGNLAISIAQTGKSVVLVDTDLRRPQTTTSFQLEGRKGLTELIDGSCDPAEVVHSTPLERFSVVPSGRIPANPAEALSMPQLAEFLQWLRQRFDYVIIDSPPLMVVADPAIVASHVDGLILTFRIRRGCRPQAKEAAAILRSVDKPIFGCVINRVDEPMKGAGYSDPQAAAYYRHRDRYGAPSEHGQGQREGADPSGRNGSGQLFTVVGNKPRRQRDVAASQGASPHVH